MYSPKINDKYIPYLFQEAKASKKHMTTIVNNVIEDFLLKVRCRHCLKEIILDEPSETAYCPFCETNVFVVRGGKR
jgi:ribosomal protein S27E